MELWIFFVVVLGDSVLDFLIVLMVRKSVCFLLCYCGVGKLFFGDVWWVCVMVWLMFCFWYWWIGNWFVLWLDCLVWESLVVGYSCGCCSIWWLGWVGWCSICFSGGSGIVVCCFFWWSVCSRCWLYWCFGCWWICFVWLYRYVWLLCCLLRLWLVSGRLLRCGWYGLWSVWRFYGFFCVCVCVCWWFFIWYCGRIVW